MLNVLDSNFGELGLKRLSSSSYGDLYQRSFEYGWQRLSINCVSDQRTIRLEWPFAGVRLDAVEEMVAKHENRQSTSTEEDLLMRTTVGKALEPEGFLSVFRKSWLIEEGSEITSVCEDFTSRVAEKVLPFWDGYSHPEEILSLLKQDADRIRRFCGPDVVCAKKAIALSLLIEGENAAKDIAESKIGKLPINQQPEVREWLGRVLASHTA